MVIEQTVEVSENRRIFLDLPLDLPVGRAKITITPIADVPRAEDKRKIHLTRLVIDEILQDEDLRSLTGLLHTNMTAEEIRAERLQKI